MHTVDLFPLIFVGGVFAISIGYLLIEFRNAKKVKN